MSPTSPNVPIARFDLFCILWQYTRMIDPRKIIGFEWDDGNRLKSLLKHGVTSREAEEIFLDDAVMFLKDVAHSEREARFCALGRTREGRFLAVIFTLRDEDRLIRVISARTMNAREVACYD